VFLRAKTEYEALRIEQRKHDELDSEHEVERTRLLDENKRLKQESDNEIAVFKGGFLLIFTNFTPLLLSEHMNETVVSL